MFLIFRTPHAKAKVSFVWLSIHECVLHELSFNVCSDHVISMWVRDPPEISLRVHGRTSARCALPAAISPDPAGGRPGRQQPSIPF